MSLSWSSIDTDIYFFSINISSLWDFTTIKKPKLSKVWAFLYKNLSALVS